MTLIDRLRISSAEALPFTRAKLQASLVRAGLRPVYAGQITACLSQNIRAAVPVEISVSISDDCNSLILEPAGLADKYAILRLPGAVDDRTIEAMRAILRRLTREELLNDLELKVKQRTAELAQERERSERLLKNMLPHQIAERMKDGETIADEHMASVLFADISGFTDLASKCEAAQVVAMLDRLFSEFDALAEKHELEKIKTIGDCYMAAAGLPLPQPDHVERAVSMGLDMIDAVRLAGDDLGFALDVRVGVHTGSLVAGVIGTRKYSYDVWGDTVNVASRMESHGVVGHVQVSDDVRKFLKNRYRLMDRGNIEIKNRGEIRSWLVLGREAI